jgi:Rps23 Pro-64 3,4-dihydroxylase Tpa1-like proline 4-hydroxylase
MYLGNQERIAAGRIMLELVNKKTRQAVGDLHAAFRDAAPFKHVIIDEFLAPEFAEALLREFPAFSPDRARNEFGKIGNKATVQEILRLGGNYRRADLLVSSQPFLQLISEITGIPDLVYDPGYFGGGTHENRDGQGLDPHVDFNWHPQTGHHRRLNLIIYLNKEWDEGWGGSIELHSNPRDWSINQVQAFAPLFNRCMLFETNERSWHGFSVIRLPNEKRYLSRKSFTIYYYTKERPAEEVAPPHGTFYVQRPLPAELTPGSVLTDETITEVRGLVDVRDSFIQLYQKKELEWSQQIQNLERSVAEWKGAWRLPSLGWARQDGAAAGFYHDGWVERRATARYRAARPLSRVCVEGWLPDHFLNGNTILLRVAGQTASARVQPGLFTLTAPLAADQGASFQLTIEAELTSSGKRRGENADAREVAFIMRELAFE